MADTKSPPKPRPGSFMGRPIPNQEFDDGTWLEGEEFAYPHGGFTRRAYAECEDGELRLAWCSIPDTAFSLPARVRIGTKTVKGFLTSRAAGLAFVAYTNQEADRD